MTDGPASQIIAQITGKILARMSDADKAELASWAQAVNAIREDASLSTGGKLKKLAQLNNSRVALPVIQAMAREAKVVLWDERGWAARLALGGAVAGLVLFGAGGVGVAAAGGAIGLPAFLLTSAGGAVVGILIEKLSGH